MIPSKSSKTCMVYLIYLNNKFKGFLSLDTNIN